MSAVLEAPATTAASGYQYRSHFDDPETRGAEPPVHESPIESHKAIEFARLGSRLRLWPDSEDTRAMLQKHPLLGVYFELAAELRAADKLNEANKTFSGLLPHLGRLFDWPITETDWAEAKAEGRIVMSGGGERARSNTDLGVRADDEVIKVIKNEPLLSKELHRYTRWVFMYLYQRQWLPIDAQLPLWSDDKRTVRTWADIVCFDLVHNRLVVVELKTGYAYNYDALQSRSRVLEAVPDTAHNRHQMQLGWMCAQLSKAAAARQLPVTGFVVRVNSLDCIPAPFELENDAREYFTRTYQRLNSWQLGTEAAAAPIQRADEPSQVPLKKRRVKRI